ncbi:hypothetical protein [Nonomuraea endophytica]|uniref:hypothetical protein n=1 Tax=Nonomuraea endophytica TaxID=714136 RepID=UPI0037C53B99
MPNHRHPVLALALAVLLSGCSPAPAVPSRPPTSPKLLRESLTADCMKRRGFTYRMAVATPTPDPLSDGDYPAIVADRKKYGFRVFAPLVDPVDAKLAVEADSNDVLADALSPTQQKAYQEAMTTCYVWAAGRALGKKVTSHDDLNKQITDAVDAALGQEFDGDPGMVELARKYASCLAARGRPVGDVRPSKIKWQVRQTVYNQLWAVGRRQQAEPVPGRRYFPNLTRAQAEPYFREEVRAAVDDIECGEKFHLAFQPRAKRVQDRIGYTWGFQ